MCTLTWWHETAESFEVFFNRDEKKTRSVAEPPRVHTRNGVSFLAPIDPDGGGTWMLANARGLVVCLLNRWHEEAPGFNAVRSRGQLVIEMAAMESVPAVGERLRGTDLTGLKPFTMVAFDPVGERAWTWNGTALSRRRKPVLPLSSSSFHHAEVSNVRLERFEELRRSGRLTGRLLEQFHADVGEGASAFSPRMLRGDAQTMSRSRVTVTRDRVHWTYLQEQREFQAEAQVFESELSLDPPVVLS